MSVLDDLYAAVLDDLDSDEPRLVLADELQRLGDPRGELIAVQCELGRLGCNRTRVAQWTSPHTTYLDWIGDALVTGDPERIAMLRDRERVLLGLHEDDWARDLPPGYRFARGFVDHVHGGERRYLGKLFELAPAITSLAVSLRRNADAIREPRLAQLRQIRIACEGEPAATAAVLDAIDELEGLRELGIGGLRENSGYKQEDRALTRLFASPVIRRLEAVDFGWQQLDSTERIAELFSIAPNLEDLRLGYGSDRGGNLAHVIAGVGGSLEILELSFAGLVSGVDEMSTALRSLRALRIHHPTLESFEAARALGDGFDELRVLDLSGTPFSQMLPDLVSGRGLARLSHLGLQRCDLDDNAIRCLFDTPLLDRLRVLDLRDNQISVDRLVQLRGRAPELEVMR